MATLRVVTADPGERSHPVWTDGQIRYLISAGALTPEMVRREMAGYCECGMLFSSPYHSPETCKRKKPLRATPPASQPWEGKAAA